MVKNLIFLAIPILGFLFADCSKKSSSDDVEADTTATPVTDAELDVKVLTENLYHPWELLWAPANQIWMTERNGNISKVDPGTGQVSRILTLPDIEESGEGGLLGMALHPDFTSAGEVFIVYDYEKNGRYTEKVVKYSYNGTTLINPAVILDDIAAAGNHNGSRLAFGPDKKLYITTGDAANTSRAQDPSSLNGKVLRINPDGSIPADNPTPGSAIWSLGHRNPQGLVFVNDKLYSSEHGPNTDDEINLIQRGGNFGWPNVAGLCDAGDEQTFCAANNVVQPIYTWTPTIAPSGMAFYNADLIPQWKNSLLLAVLKNSVLLQLRLNSQGDKVEQVNEFLKNEYGRLRDVCISPDGKVYVSTDNGNDRIIVISRKN